MKLRAGRTNPETLLQNKAYINDLLHQIAKKIAQQANDLSSFDLYNGRLGIAIFLYHYSQYSRNDIFKNLADKLIEEINENLTTSISLSFNNGIVGIGWGIAYLIQNNFIEADPDEILVDIDSFIFDSRLQRLEILECQQGIFGFGLYYLIRNFEDINDMSISAILKKQILFFLIDECEDILAHKRLLNGTATLPLEMVISITFFLLEVYKKDVRSKKIIYLLNILPNYFETISIQNTSYVERNTINLIIAEVLPYIAEKKQSKKCQNSIKSILNSLIEPLYVENICMEISNAARFNLVYNNHFQTHYEKLLEYFPIFPNENNFLCNFATLTDHKYLSNDISLNTGMAGIGLFLLQYMLPEAKKHPHVF